MKVTVSGCINTYCLAAGNGIALETGYCPANVGSEYPALHSQALLYDCYFISALDPKSFLKARLLSWHHTAAVMESSLVSFV